LIIREFYPKLTLGKVNCTYLTPLFFPDTVLVGSRVKSYEKDRIVIENAVYSQQQKQLAALGEVRLVPFDLRQMKKATVPDYLWEKLPEFN
jgi:acyl-CoA thioester hydrolase